LKKENFLETDRNEGRWVSRVAEKIKSLRLEAGMSQKALAKKLGVAESFINDVELGRKIINENMIKRISKIFNKDINDISMSVEVESMEDIYNNPAGRTPSKKQEAVPKKAVEISDAWSGALASVLKSVPVYDYSLNKVLSTKLMPIENNKIEGYSQDKVLYIEIMDDDMIGFRMAKGDRAFAHYINEPENNTFCLIERHGERMIRQIKKLDSSKLLLISNKGSVRTETVFIKDVKIIARLDRVEFKL
jgi:transcriptional regulator with XRE-family HTH domain